jgi:OOP family OmpA-OmpF porin
VLTPIASASVDKYEGTDVGFRVFGGIRIGRFFGIEAGYVDLGEPEDQIELNIPQSPPPPAAFQRPETDVELVLTDEIDGWEIFALGALPLSERWEAFAKLGVIAWDNDFKTQNAFADQFPPSPPNAPFPAVPTLTPPSSTVSDDGTDLAGGVGFNYQATEHMVLRGEGTWYDIDDTEQVWLLGFNVIISY